MKNFSKKILSAVTVFFFLASQISSGYSQAVDNLVAPSSDQSNQIQTITPAQALAKQNAPSASGQVVSPGVPDTYEFIAKQDALNQQAEKESEKKSEETKQNYELERYTFEEAQDLFRPEFASAVIIKNLKESDLKKLMDLPFEVGIAILHGELVMFSSGNKSEIDVLNPVNELLKNASFIAHTHPDQLAVEGPSGADQLNAGNLTEYVITPAGVYAYSNQGLQNNGNLLTYQYLLNRVQRTLKESRLNGLANEMLVRQELNEFIHQMDILNQAPEEERILFRSGAVIAPTSSLGAGNLTALSVQPDVLVTGGSALGTSANQPSSSSVHLNYALGTVGAYSGITLNYDNYGTPNTVESQNLSGVQSIVFGLRSNAYQVRVEFVDANNNRDSFLLTSVLSSDQFYQLNLNLLGPNVNRSQISQINFIVDRNGTMAANYFGTLDLTFANLNVTGNQIADPTLTAANVTTMPNVPTPPVPILTGGSNLAGMPNGSSLNQPTANQLDLTYNILAAGTYAGITINYDDFGTEDNNPATTTDIETRNISGLPNNEIIAGLSGPLGSNVRVEFVDINGNKDSLLVGPVTPVEQFYRLKLGFLSGVDLTRIRFINFIVNEFTVADRQDVLHLRLNGLTFTPIVAANPALTENNLSNLPLGQPVLTGGSSADSAIARVSGSEIGLDYDVTASGSYAGAAVSYDNFNTVPVEFQNLSALANLVVGVRGHNPLGGERVRVEIVDAAGGKDSIFLDNVNDIEKFYSIPTALFDAVDLTRVILINFIVDGTLVQDPTNVIQVRVNNLSQPALTVQQQAIRQNLISSNLEYFRLGIGIDPVTHFPYDNISATAVPQSFTQPTAIGFYVQMLADISNGLMPSSFLTSSQALTEADLVLTNLISAQASFGWNGLLPFMNLSPLAPSTNIVGFGDNANLAQSLAVMIGGLERGTYSPADQIIVNGIITKVNTVLANMAPGFNALVDPTFGLFHNSVNTSTGQFISYQDRHGNEFRAAVAFIVAFYGINRSVWDNMLIVTRNYTDSGGTIIENFSPFDGGAFQIFWPLLRTSEQKFVEMLPALRNALYTFADFSKRNNIPGFVSASSTPEGGYQGLEGIIDIAEILSDVLTFDIGSVYALASAYAVDPDFVIFWLDNIRAQFPALSGPFGLFDSARSFTELNQRYFAIDQSSIVLGLANNGGDNFDAFMVNRGLDAAFSGLYEDLFINITPNTKPLPTPPTVPARTFTVFNNFSSEGITGTFPFQATNITGLNINYAGQVNRQGHFWVLDQVHDARGETIKLKYSVTNSPQEIEVELVDALNNRLGLFTVPIVAGPGVQEATIQVPNLPAFQFVDQVRIILNPPVTGVQSANFKVHQFTFSYLGLPVVLQPSGTLTAADVTTIPGNPFLIRTGGSTAATSVNQQSASQFALNFNNTIAGQYGGATITPENFGVAGNETVDISTIPQLVFGISSTVAATQAKIELEDVNGVKAIFNIANVGAAEQFYAIDVNTLPPGFDRTRVHFINFIIDSVNTGILNIRTGGLLFTTFFGPDGTQTVANVTNLTGIPVARLVRTGGSTAATTVTQNSGSQFTLGYNNAVAGNYGGATITFDDFGTDDGNPATTTDIERRDLTGVANLVLGISGNIATAKVEVVDVNNVKAVFNLSGITAAEQFWRLPLSSGLPAGFQLNNVTSINVIEDGIGTGNLNVRLSGVEFIPVFTQDLTATFGDISTLNNPSPSVIQTFGSTAASTISQLSVSEIFVNYNNTQPGHYGGGTLNFDNFGTAPVEFINLSAVPELIFSLRSNPDFIDVKLELVDTAGNARYVILSNLTSTEQFYRIPLSSFPGVNLNQIRFINFVSDENGAGNFVVRTNGQQFTNFISPAAGLTAANVSTLPQIPVLSGTPGIDAATPSQSSATVTQTSSTQIRMNYNNGVSLSGAPGFSGMLISVGNFTPPLQGKNFSGLSEIILGLQGTPSTAKVELVDINNVTAVFNLSGIISTEQFWRLPLNALPSGFDLNSVMRLNVVVDQLGVGTIDARIGGLIPLIPANPALTLADVSNLPGSPAALLGPLSFAGSTVTQSSSSEIVLNYNHTGPTSGPGTSSGITVTFDDFGTAPIESQNLSGLTNLVLGLRGGFSQGRVELVDASGAIFFVRLNGITQSEQFWNIPLSSFQGVNLSQTRQINFVFEGQGTGTMTVRLNGQQFTPTVTPNPPGVTVADITVLPTVTGSPLSFPIPGLTNGSSAPSSVTSDVTGNPDLINLNYDVTAGGSYSGTTLLYENFSTPQQETGDLTAGGNNRLVFGVRRTGAGAGAGTIRVKLELVDASGMRATVFLDSVTANPSLYEIPLSMLPAGFNRTQVSMLSFVVDQNGIAGGAPQTGTLEVSINGIG